MKFLKSRGFLVFLGLVLLSLFIWFGGPYLAFADCASGARAAPAPSWRRPW
jgi:hypothetical protein